MIAEAQKNPVAEWFDAAVAQLRADEVAIETGVASEEKKKHYDILIRGNDDEMAHNSKILSDKHFFLNMMKKFIRSLFSRKPISITHLAFSYCDSQVLTWVQLPEDLYDETEKAIILAEAEVNAAFYKYGYTMSTTLVEDSDQLDIPDHYVSVNVDPINLK